MACILLGNSTVHSAQGPLLLQEFAIYKHLGNHRHIVRLVAACEDDHSVYMVFNLCEHGELPAHLAQKPTLSEKEIVELFAQIVEAVAHCHEHGDFLNFVCYLQCLLT